MPDPMSGLFSNPPHVTVRRHDADDAAALSFRWEAPDGSDAEAIEGLVAGDPARFVYPNPQRAARLVRALRESDTYLQMTSQLALAEGRPVGYVLLTQVLVGDRTYLLHVGDAIAPDAPQGTRARLLGTVLHTARAGFYSAIVATTHAGDIPGVTLTALAAHNITVAPASPLPADELQIGELHPCGIDDHGGQLVLDPAFGQ